MIRICDRFMNQKFTNTADKALIVYNHSFMIRQLNWIIRFELLYNNLRLLHDPAHSLHVSWSFINVTHIAVIF